MTFARIVAAAAALLLAAPALAAPGCPAIPPRTPMPREATPEQIDIPAWRGRVAELDQALARSNRAAAELVFIGDSITQSWEPTMFGQFFGARRTLNLGVWGDFTQGALWRLAAGQWGTMQPKVAVVLLGTNNAASGGRADDTALGLAEIVRFIHARSPRTRVLLVGLLPRGADRADPFRAINARVNELVARCADGRSTVYIDPGALLVGPDGALSEHVAFDRLHLTMVGYAILGAALAPTVNRMLSE